nr:C39 family peptidase [Saccharibacillus sp. JS10]
MNRQGTISHASIKPHIQQNFEPNFPGVNNCSMSVITTIFEYYRNIGYTNINSSLSGLYSDVRTIGVKYGYTPLDGTSPTKMNNIVNDVWKKYGYSGTGSNQYLYSFDTFTAEIDNRRPAMFNLAYGYYSNHSITVVGYREFKKTEANKARFLKEFDNWTTNDRYVDYNSLTESTVGSVTLIRP